MVAPEFPQVQPSDLEAWLAVAPTLSWRFASTMQSVPHSYVVRHRSLDDERYRRAFGAIRTFGTPGKFHERTNIYLHDEVTDQRWWLMSRHDWESKILNKADDGRMYGVQDAPSTKNQWFAPYDHVAAYYDNSYLSTTKQERLALWKTAETSLPGRKPKTLDLGAGTGGTLDARISGAPDTTVVDISQGMLNDLVMKHPRVGSVVPASVEEFLSWETGQNFELAIASFGSASYLTPEAIAMLPSVSRGAVILSFYRPGFIPTQYRAGIPEMQRPDDSESMILASQLARSKGEEQGNYMVFTIRGEA